MELTVLGSWQGVEHHFSGVNSLSEGAESFHGTVRYLCVSSCEVVAVIEVVLYPLAGQNTVKNVVTREFVMSEGKVPLSAVFVFSFFRRR